MPDRRISRRLFLALAAPVIGAACETVPYTGRSQLQLISAEQEVQMGAQAYTQTLAKEKLSTDPVATEMVRRVGSRIAAVSGRNEYQWEYRLIQNDKSVNAFALLMDTREEALKELEKVFRMIQEEYAESGKPLPADRTELLAHA